MNPRRRVLAVIIGASTLTAPFGAFAQQQPPAKVPRIGFLGSVTAAGFTSRMDAFHTGLRELGYVDGKNIAIEYRWAEGKYERLPALAAELVALKVDLIVTHGPGVRAARNATTTIPIVVASGSDLVASGTVVSEARPGGNITGSTIFNPEIAAKRLELLKTTIPRIRRIAVLYISGSSVNPILAAMDAAAPSLKLDLQPFGVSGPDEFESAFAAISKQRFEAVAVVEDGVLIANAEAVARLTGKYRIPSVGFVELVEGGGLMAYGSNTPALYRRAAVFVDKILKGAKPGDLPIERPTRFELIINMKTANALGIMIPQSVLMRADRVIE